MLTGIIGGGLSGLTFQRFLKSDSEILEKEARTGGLCRTFEKDGFRYDIGGHILFSRDKDFLPFLHELLGENIARVRRENKVLFKGRYVKYPFENALGSLAKEDTYECLIGYLKNTAPVPANFKEWMYSVFGTGITEKYLLPYNEKIWKFPIDQMSMDWVERVPRPPMEDVVKSAVGIETEGYVHQLFFDYPKSGGIETLPRAMQAPGARVVTGFDVRTIRGRNGAWIVSDGNKEKHYDRLVLTIPLDRAVACFENVPGSVMAAAAGLRYNSVRIVMIGIDDASLMDKTAVYVPDPEVAAHRICFMGSFSRTMVPAGMSSLMAEISAPAGHPLADLSDEEMMGRVIEDGVRLGMFQRKAVIARDIQNIPYGYVVYDLHFQQHMKVVRAYFDSLGIGLLGRFAEFDYINMDEVVRRARARAQAFDLKA